MNNFYDPEHPARHFSTGNEETLKDVDQGTLKSFYERHYSSNRMALVMMSSKPLRLDGGAMPKPSFLPLKIARSEAIVYPEQYLPKVEAVRFIEIKPVKDLKELRLSFCLPFLDAHIEAPTRRPLGLHPGPRGGSYCLNSKQRTSPPDLVPAPWPATQLRHLHLQMTLTPKDDKR